MDRQPNIFDVLIVGSGGAGCSAALTAHEAGCSVAIVTRADFLDSKTSRAQGGIQAPLSLTDSADKLYQDTLKAGEFANNSVLTRLLADNAVEAVNWLIKIGVEFDRDAEGKLLTRTAAGLSESRILSCGDASGNRIMNPLKASLQETDVAVFEYRTVENVTCIAEGQENLFTVHTFDPRDENPYNYTAKTVILASGGAMPKAKRVGLQFVGNRPPPDSIQLAEKIGLNVVSPELTQYHPTGILSPKEMRRKPVPELVRSMGATLLDKNLNAFVDPMLTRKRLCEKIIEACEQGNGISTDDGRIGVWLDTPRVDSLQGAGYLQKHFKTLFDGMLEHGHDISKDPILVYPIAHYSLGGIEIDANCQTSIEGIFAAGEATWGVHGNDRLMGNSLLEIFVFGRLAGACASATVKKRPQKVEP